MVGAARGHDHVQRVPALHLRARHHLTFRAYNISKSFFLNSSKYLSFII
jgi:hypothetical protein